MFSSFWGVPGGVPPGGIQQKGTGLSLSPFSPFSNFNYGSQDLNVKIIDYDAWAVSPGG